MNPLPCPLAVTARRFPNRVALRSSSARLTYANLERSVRAFSTRLRQRGIQPGQRVAVLGPRDTDCVIAFWSLLRCGATICPINSSWPAKAVTDTRNVAQLQHLLTPRDWSRASQLESASTVENENDLPRIGVFPATIIFSSGSSGAPKAVVHDASAHVASAQGANANMPLAAGDAWLLSLPLFHVSGVALLFRCVIAGATVIVPDEGCSLSQQIERHQPTHLSMVPTQLSRLLHNDHGPPNGLKAVLLGGAPLSVELVQRARRAGWPMHTTYGLSEMASQVTTTPPLTDEAGLRTAGHVLQGREVHIAEDQEILVRGSTLFRGYLRAGSVVPTVDEDGWFHTGDLGHWDDAGRLVVTGRRDLQFITGGENVYPEEIERELLSIPGILQAIIVPIPDAEFGQRPVAFVESAEWQVDTWREALTAHLPRFKIPDHFFAWPAQCGFKPQRRDLQDLAVQQLASS